MLKSRHITLPTKVHSVKAMVFPVVRSRYESWTIKKAKCQRINAFELWSWRRLESPLDNKESKPNPKGDQPWIFIERIVAEAPALWLPNAKSQLIRKDPDAEKGWGQEKKGATENEMVGWHDQLNGHEFEQAPGDSEGQWSLACCSSWGCKESDSTYWLNNNKNRSIEIIQSLFTYHSGIINMIEINIKRYLKITLLFSSDIFQERSLT